MDMQINGARLTFVEQLAQQVVGEGAVRRNIEADDLHIDGRGKPEVQDLADHVRRQERERRRWIGRRKPRAQYADESRGGLMAFLEIDEYVAVSPGPPVRNCAVCQIDAAMKAVLRLSTMAPS